MLAILFISLIPVEISAYNGDTIVYVTDTGNKYHNLGCRSLWNSSTPYKLIDAVNGNVKSGKKQTPCSVCNPPVLEGWQDTSEKVTVSTSKTNNSSSPTAVAVLSNPNNVLIVEDGGKYYHAAGCKVLHKATTEVSVQEAISRNYKPCSVCNPHTDIRPQNRNVIIYLNSSNCTYHRENCPHVSNSSRSSLGFAIEKGYTACTVCCPASLGDLQEDDTYDYYEYAEKNHLVTESDGSANISTCDQNSDTNSSSNASSSSNTSDIDPSWSVLLMLVGVGFFSYGFIIEPISDILKKEKEIDQNNKKRIEEERHLYRSIDVSIIRKIAGVPDNITFTADGLPKDNNDQIYGSFTVYISDNGKHYHRKRGCHSANKPVHVFKAIKEYKCCYDCGKPYKGIPYWYREYERLMEKYKRYNDINDN